MAESAGAGGRERAGEGGGERPRKRGSNEIEEQARRAEEGRCDEERRGGGELVGNWMGRAGKNRYGTEGKEKGIQHGMLRSITRAM